MSDIEKVNSKWFFSLFQNKNCYQIYCLVASFKAKGGTSNTLPIFSYTEMLLNSLSHSITYAKSSHWFKNCLENFIWKINPSQLLNTYQLWLRKFLNQKSLKAGTKCIKEVIAVCLSCSYIYPHALAIHCCWKQNNDLTRL